MEQMRKRASQFRNRLEFKEGQTQKQLSQDMKEKLREIECGQEVVLEVERPKALHKESIDGALLLKQEQTKSQEDLSKALKHEREVKAKKEE